MSHHSYIGHNRIFLSNMIFSIYCCFCMFKVMTVHILSVIFIWVLTLVYIIIPHFPHCEHHSTLSPCRPCPGGPLGPGIPWNPDSPCKQSAEFMLSLIPVWPFRPLWLMLVRWWLPSLWKHLFPHLSLKNCIDPLKNLLTLSDLHSKQLHCASLAANDHSIKGGNAGSYFLAKIQPNLLENSLFSLLDSLETQQFFHHCVTGV